MAREKNTVPSTLKTALDVLAASATDYAENLTTFENAVASGDYEASTKALKKGHELVLKIKDLHNGLYQFNRAPKVEKPAKPVAPMDSEKNETEDITPPAKSGKLDKLHKEATKAQEAKALAAAATTVSNKTKAKLKVKAKAK